MSVQGNRCAALPSPRLATWLTDCPPPSSALNDAQCPHLKITPPRWAGQALSRPARVRARSPSRDVGRNRMHRQSGRRPTISPSSTAVVITGATMTSRALPRWASERCATRSFGRAPRPTGSTAPTGRWPTARLPELARLGIAPIVGLVHHGSGPRHTSLLDPGFATGLAEFAGAVAARYPWVERLDPCQRASDDGALQRASTASGIRTPATTARSSRPSSTSAAPPSWRWPRSAGSTRRPGWSRPTISARTYGTDAACRRGRLLQRAPLARAGTCFAAGSTEHHPLWTYLRRERRRRQTRSCWFAAHPCPPDIIGVNYYVTSERWLDHRLDRYPGRMSARPRRATLRRCRVGPRAGHARAGDRVVAEARRGERYRHPAGGHRGAHRRPPRGPAALAARDLARARRPRATQAPTSARSRPGRCSALSTGTACSASAAATTSPDPSTCARRQPRATALATLIAELAAGRTPSHPVLHGDGWWRRAERFLARPVRAANAVTPLAGYRPGRGQRQVAPILISGATGTLGRAFARACARRNLAYRMLDREAHGHRRPGVGEGRDPAVASRGRSSTRAAMCASTMPSPTSIAASARTRSGPRSSPRNAPRPGSAWSPSRATRCSTARAVGPTSRATSRRPLNVYGRSKAVAERDVLALCPQALVVRTSAFFGPWDSHNFVIQALGALAQGEAFDAADDVRDLADLRA